MFAYGAAGLGVPTKRIHGRRRAPTYAVEGSLSGEVNGIGCPSVITAMVPTGGHSFESFFAASKDDVYRSLLVITRDRSLAEDGVAEAYTRAFERWAEIEHHPAPKAWVARTAINYVRSDRRRTRLFTSSLPDHASNDGVPTDPHLVAHVLRLPKRQREVVALRILLDLSADRTAELLGITSGAVGAHLFRALRRLEREVEETGTKEVEG